MPLKFKIDDIDSVEEPFRGLYEKGDDGKYRLSVEGVDDVEPLKRAKDHEKQARVEAEKKAKELTAELEQAKKEAQAGQYDRAKTDGDIAALEESWKAKLEATQTEYESKMSAVQSALEAAVIDAAVDDVSSIFVAPKAMMPFVRSKLKVEIADGRPSVRVVGDDGKPTAMSIDELKESLKSDESLAAVIVGSKASGGGVGGDSGAGNSGSGSPDFNKMSRKERLLYFKNKKQG